MRYIALALILTVGLGLSGCVFSLQPLYTDKDLIFEPGLLGDWVEAEPDSRGTLIFSKWREGEYKVISTDGKDTSSFSGHLVKLGDKRFLDLSADSSMEIHTLVIPVHIWLLVSQTASTLQMRDFNHDWLVKVLEKEPTALRHEFVDEMLVLTASTPELQRFVILHANDKEAFESSVDYVRKK